MRTCLSCYFSTICWYSDCSVDECDNLERTNQTSGISFSYIQARICLTPHDEYASSIKTPDHTSPYDIEVLLETILTGLQTYRESISQEIVIVRGCACTGPGRRTNKRKNVLLFVNRNVLCCWNNRALVSVSRKIFT
jgi:hypothetical protein